MKNNQPVFPGFSKPSSDFPAVRTELRAPPMYRDIDLSVARSLQAGTAETLTIVGNMVYVDQKANSGYAVLHVQDDSYVGNTPITAFPGFLVRVPFTQILLENVAQPGQVMRLIYGTDLDFVPTVGAGVSVLNAVNILDSVNPACRVAYDTNGALAFGVVTVTPILLPAANARGVVVREFFLNAAAGAGGSIQSQIVAAAVAPVAVGALSNALVLAWCVNNTATAKEFQVADMARSIPAGWGLWFVDAPQVANGGRTGSVSFEVL